MKVETVFGIAIIILAVITILASSVLWFFDLGYKQGQIDAINGKIEYVLVKQPDGSTKWESKK